ncbi:MAG: AraC family transcriptional regulator [Clostridium sp.]|nr:AraC family transcriptional regulator [Clostridium sp.]
MDILNRLNASVAYIENHLQDHIDINEAAQIAYESADSFCRLFRALSGMTVNDYIKKRRLSLAAIELQNTDEKVIDIAFKYGFNSSDVFRRAFMKQHGMTPSKVMNSAVSVNIYPPITFYIDIKGGEKMNFKIIDTDEKELLGITKHFGGKAGERFEQEHIMWADDCANTPEKICDGYDGLWYGVWDKGDYSIAREKTDAVNKNLTAVKIPAGRYAVFTSERGVYAGDAFPKMHRQIFDSWLDNSGYKPADDLEIEVYHLWTDRAERRKKRFFEIWVPIIEK